jgi:hypothetical protein
MSGFKMAMQGFDAPTAAVDRAHAKRVLEDILSHATREVRFPDVLSFHKHLRDRFHFDLVRNTGEFVQPGGRHLFYQNFWPVASITGATRGTLLLRVKTSGTRFHPRPHMTLSLAVGLDFDAELGKFSHEGFLLPKLGPGRGGFSQLDYRTLGRMGGTVEAAMAIDDRWADACHFDFAEPFDGAGAESLRVRLP